MTTDPADPWHIVWTPELHKEAWEYLGARGMYSHGGGGGGGREVAWTVHSTWGGHIVFWFDLGPGLRDAVVAGVTSPEIAEMVAMIWWLTAEGLMDDRHRFLSWLTGRRYLWRRSRTVRKALGVSKSGHVPGVTQAHWLPGRTDLRHRIAGVVEPHPLAWSQEMIVQAGTGRLDQVWPYLGQSGPLGAGGHSTGG